MLKVLERFDLAGLEHNGPEHGYVLSAALAWAGVTRFRYLSDPEHNVVPVDELLSDAQADETAARIRRASCRTPSRSGSRAGRPSSSSSTRTATASASPTR